MLTFDKWLIDQQHREDLIGELARIPGIQDVEYQFSRRKPDEHKTWADIVIGIVEPEYIAIFNKAWQEFSLVKQVAKAPPD